MESKDRRLLCRVKNRTNTPAMGQKEFCNVSDDVSFCFLIIYDFILITDNVTTDL